MFHRNAILASSLALASLLGTAAQGQLVPSMWRYGQAYAFVSGLDQLNVSVPPVVARSRYLGHSSPDKVLHVAVSLPYGDAQGMQAFVDSVSDPKSPEYRKFITPDEVGAMFGLPINRVDAVVNYLKSYGLHIKLVGKNRLSILADGTVAQCQKVFHTTINEYRTYDPKEHGNTRYYSFATPLQMPSNLAGDVLDVSGLENFTKPFPMAINVNQGRTLYATSPFFNKGKQGQGRTVAISSWDGYLLSNIPTFYSTYQLPTPPGGVGSNVTVIPVDGGYTGGANGEADLDIQLVLGYAPLCNFLIYDGGGPLIDVLTQEANDNQADIISESYGWALSPSSATSAHNLHLSMNAQGITYMCASGDSGTNIGYGFYTYSFYEPEVLLVGGTEVTVQSDGTRVNEVAWPDGGGGWDDQDAVPFNKRPSWQVGTGVPTNINYRLGPDVAGNAGGPSDAYYIVFNGQLTTFSGTSCSSPAFAGGLATAEQQLMSLGGLPPNSQGKRRFGRINDLFYSQNGRSDVWYDVTSGSNGILPNGSISTAGLKWDFCTGWGAINFDKFVQTQLNNGNNTVNVSPSSVALLQGTYVSGSLNDIVNGTGTGYREKSATVPGVGESSIVQLTFPTGLAPTKIVSIAMTYKVSAVSGADPTGQIFLWNFTTSKWELVKSHTVIHTGATVQIPFTLYTKFANYVSSQGDVRALVRFLSPIGRRGEPGTSFTGNVRYAKFAVTKS